MGISFRLTRDTGAGDTAGDGGGSAAVIPQTALAQDRRPAASRGRAAVASAIGCPYAGSRLMARLPQFSDKIGEPGCTLRRAGHVAGRRPLGTEPIAGSAYPIQPRRRHAIAGDAGGC